MLSGILKEQLVILFERLCPEIIQELSDVSITLEKFDIFFVCFPQKVHFWNTEAKFIIFCI